MRDENRKLAWWIVGGGILTVFIVIFATLIIPLICKSDSQLCLIVIILITALAYVVISIIKIIQYSNFCKSYEKEKLEEVSKELSSEFKEVFLNYSDPICKDLFKCKAKIDDNGKIICIVELDYQTKFEDYKEFLEFFHIFND